MANRVAAATREGIHTLFQWGAMGNWTDSQLVAQFLTGQDGSEAAFRVLIHRHGPMVLAICRRVLGDEHAAEDAFQTTFLVLVRKAGGLRDGNLLTNWLYGVALRVARKERDKGTRRRTVERQAAEQATEVHGDLAQVELRSVIDEEIHRLPEHYRVPLVLCHIEGLRHDEVARRLGCPVGTIESRLSRARAQLRTRLARRGLEPSASVIGAILKPPGAQGIAPPLVEATLKAAVNLAASRALAGTGILTGWTWTKRTLAFVPAFHPGTVVSALIAGASVAVMGLAAYHADGEPASLDVAKALPRPTDSDRASPPANPTVSPRSQPAPSIAATTKPIPQTARNQEPSTETHRFPSALAHPLTDITIDGRLDDWPKNLKKNAIANQLLDHPNYNANPVDAASDPKGYFMAGFDPKAEQIYLAVVVHDHDVVVHPTDVLKTDAVEIYIDGAFSKTKLVAESPSDGLGDQWHNNFDAARMPVLQYVGVPGAVSAFGDRWKANPSLVYARTQQSATTMIYRQEGDVITYEWSVKPFDRFPDRPTRLYPGKRLGLEVAVVDKDKEPLASVRPVIRPSGLEVAVVAKDKAPAKNSRPPTFWTWGSPPKVFKGLDAGSLGELILTGQPPP